MFEKGHKNKKIHLLRLAVMAALFLVFATGCMDAVGYML